MCGWIVYLRSFLDCWLSKIGSSRIPLRDHYGIITGATRNDPVMLRGGSELKGIGVLGFWGLGVLGF